MQIVPILHGLTEFSITSGVQDEPEITGRQMTVGLKLVCWFDDNAVTVKIGMVWVLLLIALVASQF